MKVVSMFIDGFGDFFDKQIGPFNSSVVVFFGPNESGKSTILNYIRTILFGFPARKKKELYPPMEGGHHGGRIVINDGQRNDFVVERYADRQVSIRDMSGTSLPEEKLEQLLGSTTKSVFEHVFAFDLLELFDPLLDDENINNQIYSAGVGATKLPQLFKSIEKIKNDIYRPGGSVKTANILATDIEETESTIRDLTNETDQYDQLQKRLIDYNTQFDAVILQIEEKQKLSTKLDLMTKGWESWNKLTNTLKQMESIPEPNGLFEPVEEELNRLQNYLEPEKVYLQNDEIKHNNFKRGNSDSPILGDEKKIKEIIQKLEAVRYAEDSDSDRGYTKNDIEREISSTYERFNKQLEDIGPDWDFNTLNSSKITSTGVINEFRELSDRMKKNSDGKVASQSSVVVAQKSLKTTKNQCEQEVTNVSPDWDLNDLNSSKITSEEVINEFRELSEQMKKNSENRVAFQTALDTIKTRFGAGQTNPAQRRMHPWIITLSVSALGIILFFSFLDLNIFVRIGAVITTVVGWGFGLHKLITAKDVIKENLVDHKKEKTELAEALSKTLVRSNDLQTRWEQLLQTHNLPNNLDAESLTEIRTRVKTALTMLNNVETHKDTVEEYSGTLKTFLNESHEIKRSCQELLSAHNLPINLNPESVGEIRANIETARATYVEIDKLQARHKRIVNLLDEFFGQLEQIANKHNEPFTRGSIQTYYQAAEQLSDRLDVAKGKIGQELELSNNVEERKANIKKIQANITRLVTKTHSKDLDELYKKLSDNKKIKELEMETENLHKHLQNLSGPGDLVERFKKELRKTSFEQIQNDITVTSQELKQLRETEKTIIDEKSKISANVALIENEDELSGLRLKRNQLTENLDGEMRGWLKYSLAEQMLTMAREKFQKERQPAVLQHASDSFKAITNNEYTDIFATLGEQTIKVIDKRGREKTPAQLSRGTREQLYLALRLGLIRNYQTSSSIILPIIVDEITVNFDPGRGLSALSLFADLSKTHQVLVFTCHEEVVKQIKLVCPNAQIEDVSFYK